MAMDLPPPPPEADAWAFRLATPSWLAGAWGETGVYGKNANVNVLPRTIVNQLTFTAAFSAEARRDRLGIYADYLYLGEQAGVSPGGLVSRLDFKFTETIADIDVNWRIAETPCGWVDLLAGVRYMSVYTRLGLHPDTGAIDKVSMRLVDATSAVVGRVLDDALNDKNPVLPVPPLAEPLKSVLLKAIAKARQDPALIAAIASGDPVAIAQAKADVSRNIAHTLTRGLECTFSLNEDWFDPYLGIKGRLNLSKGLYLTAKADVGGFGAGSRICVEAIGAAGWQITRNVWAEAGYKYLYVDYRHDGFLFDISSGGALLTIGMNF